MEVEVFIKRIWINDKAATWKKNGGMEKLFYKYFCLKKDISPSYWPSLLEVSLREANNEVESGVDFPKFSGCEANVVVLPFPDPAGMTAIIVTQFDEFTSS